VDPWDDKVMEVIEGHLDLLLYMIDSPLARDLQASIKIHKLDFWGKSTK
jgi:hypothetical protein